LLIQQVSDPPRGLSPVPEQPSPSYAAGFSRPERSFTPEEPITGANIDETIVSTDLHATSEALNMLSHAAQLDSYITPSRPHVPDRLSVTSPGNLRTNLNLPRFEQMHYPLVAKGLLTIEQVSQLVARYVSSGNSKDTTDMMKL
jgi:hypothetical protein